MAGYIGNKAVGLNVTTGDILGDVGVGGDLSLGDNDKAIFGAGSDLQIYHDGSNSVIEDAGTGRMFIKSNGSDISLSTNSDIMLKAINDGAVELYHNNSKKLATTSTGVAVTGAISASSGNVTITDGNLTVAAGHGIDFSAQTQSSATTTAELLDHYEEGTGAFSSVTNAAGNALSVTSNAFNYTKIGNVVQLEIRVQLASATTAEVRLNGPPFTISSTDTVLGEVISERIVFAASGTQIKLLAGDNNAYMYGVVNYRAV